MDCSTPGSSVLHYLPGFAQSHVHWTNDAIYLSHPLPPSSPFAFNISQHQGLFQWVGSSHQVAKVLELQLQHQSFQWIFRVDTLFDWLFWSPCCPRDSQESSLTPQFKSINSMVLSLLYGPTLTSVLGLNSILDTFQCSSSGVISFCIFMPSMGQEYWGGFPFPSPGNHVLSELFTMTQLSWVAPHSMAHSFTELHKPLSHYKTVILVCASVISESLWPHRRGK